MDRPDSLVTPLSDGPAVPAELIFLAIVAAMLGLLLLAGIPLGEEPVAGDGSERLRRGWAGQLAEQPGAPLPSGRGRDELRSSR